MKNRNVMAGIVIGTLAGIVDSGIMIFRQSPTDMMLSTFSFWVVAGFFIAISDVKFKGAVKGAILSLVLLVPIGIPIVFEEPASLISVTAFTAVLGGIMGYLIERFSRKA